MAVGLAAQLAFAVWAMGGLWQGVRAAATRDDAGALPARDRRLSRRRHVSVGFRPAGLGEPRLRRGVPVLAGDGGRHAQPPLIHQPALPAPMRATIGIHFAPPAVGCVAWLAVTSGAPDMLARIFSVTRCFRRSSWRASFPGCGSSPCLRAYGAYSFAISALPLAALRLVERSMDGAPAQLAPWLFAIANLLIGGFAIGSLTLLAQGRLVPPRRRGPTRRRRSLAR